MRRHTLALLLLSRILGAQQVVAPTPAQVGSARGENVGDYNVMSSYETGYRFAMVGGERGVYRSDVNFGNGVRLLGSNLTVNSRDGHGHLFDEIVLSTTGLGNDPYESARLRIEKNHLYDYQMLWRLNDYFNPALLIAQGDHALNTRRTLQDHDLTLLPQSKLTFHLGYGRNTQSGPALTTIQAFDSRGGIFPLFADIRRSFDEYRLGADLDLFGVKLTVLHRWEYFKDDTGLEVTSLTTNPTDQAVLNRFHRAEPIHGSSPGWLGNLMANKKWWSANGRFTYTGGQRGFIDDENAIGIDRFNNNRNREVLVTGDAHRPLSTGALSLSVFPGERLTLVNSTSFYNNRIDGNSNYLEFNPATFTQQLVSFQYLGIRAIANATDLHYRVSRWINVYAGYHYSARRIQALAGIDVPPSQPTHNFTEQNNHLQAGAFGVRLQPAKPLTINLDAEIGRNDRPFTPISDNNYHALAGRAEYKAKKFVLTAGYRQNYNGNSVKLSSYSSRARDYTANASWVPRDWFALDAGYAKLHLDTVAGIAFFAGAPRPAFTQGLDSIYVSNIHSASLGARFVIRKKVDVYAGYSINRDTGDGRGVPVAAAANAIAQVFVPVETFPLSFQSPLARVSVRLSPKVRWNAGWQYYNYHEDFNLLSVYQNYHAHTGYTSVLWTF